MLKDIVLDLLTLGFYSIHTQVMNEIEKAELTDFDNEFQCKKQRKEMREIEKRLDEKLKNLM